jgi:uncharacterized repeat protein (TIGR03803 family)
VPVPKYLKITCIFFILAAASPIISAGQTFKTLFSFDGTDGIQPEYVVLVQGRDGALYGTTAGGGAYSYSGGTVFKVKDGGVQTLYSFCAQSNCTDGAGPTAGLVLGDDGNFYGTTSAGGAYNGGTVFKITPSGSLTTLYSFCAQPNCTDGEYPEAKLLLGSDGNFYGTTYWAGANANNLLYDDGGGTVFKITPSGNLTTLYSFCSQTNCVDGDSSLGGLIQAPDGTFYGTTTAGGTGLLCTGACGTIFNLTSTGTLTTLYNFCSERLCTDGGIPMAGLLLASNGSFYGTTNFYGTSGAYGTAFVLAPTGQFNTLVNFCYGLGCEGSNPSGGLIHGTNGKLYGATGLYTKTGCLSSEDRGGCGTIFSLTEAGSLNTLFSFCVPQGKQAPISFNCRDGAGPLGGIMQATNGNFYGVTMFGGAFNAPDGDGTVFEYSAGLRPFVTFVRANGTVGQTVGILGQGFTGTTSVSLNGSTMIFTVVSDTFLQAKIPAGATTGVVTVTTPAGTLTSNVVFNVLP